MKKLFFVFVFFYVLIPNVSSQNFVQNIRGVVIDKQSQSPMPDVNIMVLNSSPVIGTTTDINGKFVLSKIHIGRVGVQFSFIGYNQIVINNLVLTSGKELILNISMEETVNVLKDITIISQRDKEKYSKQNGNC